MFSGCVWSKATPKLAYIVFSMNSLSPYEEFPVFFNLAPPLAKIVPRFFHFMKPDSNPS